MAPPTPMHDAWDDDGLYVNCRSCGEPVLGAKLTMCWELKIDDVIEGRKTTPCEKRKVFSYCPHCWKLWNNLNYDLTVSLIEEAIRYNLGAWSKGRK